jgi:hypothetical protein
VSDHLNGNFHSLSFRRCVVGARLTMLISMDARLIAALRPAIVARPAIVPRSFDRGIFI